MLAYGAAVAFTLCVALLARARNTGEGSIAGLVLTGALALGVILASDVFHSGSSVETLLFGSLLAIGRGDQDTAAGASVATAYVAIFLTALLGRALARGAPRARGAARPGSGRSRLGT